VAWGDWGHWRGAQWTGVSQTKASLPTRLDATTQAYGVALPGKSSATPVVADGKIFIVSNQSAGKPILAMGFDLKTGKELWRHELATVKSPNRNTPASASPTVVGDRVVWTLSSGLFVATDFAGKELWRSDLTKQIGPFCVKFGYSTSPLYCGGELYIALIRQDPGRGRASMRVSYLLRMDAKTGTIVARCARPCKARKESGDSYSSPLPIFDSAGKIESILITGGDTITAHDPKTLKEQWRVDYDPKHASTTWRLVPSAVVAGRIVVTPRPRGDGMIALELGKTPAETPKQKWLRTETFPDVTTLAAKDGVLYVANDKKGTFMTLDVKTGKTLSTTKLGGVRPWASPTIAGGKVYLLGPKGEWFVFSAAAKPKLLAKGKFNGSSEVYSTIVVTDDGSVLVRTNRKLLCFRAPAKDKTK
ncbi:MAG: PQQ-binding-like beta-propeller repeat protein, partial [Phycisphaerales bacterium]|nr:PQQ-binding-like beta-propeller repeat protein [Phycisphaerales bacterium]